MDLVNKNNIRILLISSLLIILAGFFAADDASADSTTKGWDVNLYTNESKLWINEANFPDPVFRQYISDNFDDDENGYIGFPEILEYTDIRVGDNRDLHSVSGIEYFTNLKMLYLSKTNVSHIPASSFEYLEQLYCGNTLITELDVTKCTRLQILYLSQTAVSSIDLSNCPQLLNLVISETNIDALDLSKLSNLIALSVNGTQISKLDVSHNHRLKTLQCSNTNLSNLDVSNLHNLNTLSVSYTNISDLNLDNSLNLYELFCDKTKLTRLNLKNHTKLTLLWCTGTPLSYINLPENFNGDFYISNYISSSVNLKDDSLSLNPSEYWPGFDSSKVSNVQGATFRDGIFYDLYPGNSFTYEYACNASNIKKFSVQPLAPNNTFYLNTGVLTPVIENGTITYTFDKNYTSSMSIRLAITEADADSVYILLTSPQNNTSSSVMSASRSFLSFLFNDVSNDVTVITDSDTYKLSSTQIKLILARSTLDSLTDVTFTHDASGKQLITLSGGSGISSWTGILNETSISSVPQSSTNPPVSDDTFIREDPSGKEYANISAKRTSLKKYLSSKPFEVEVFAPADIPLEYKSSDPSIVEISSSGIATVKKAGSVKVTVSVAENSKYTGGSVTTTIRVYPAKAKMTKKPWTDGKKRIKVRWATQAGVVQYQIRYSTSSTFKSYKTKTVSALNKGYSTQSTTIKNLKSGKTYYFKVRAIYKGTDVNGKTAIYYGNWSPWRSCKAK